MSIDDLVGPSRNFSELTRREAGRVAREDCPAGAQLVELPKQRALGQALALFDRIAHPRIDRPMVAVLGDLYVRDNEVFDHGLVRAIRRNG